MFERPLYLLLLLLIVPIAGAWIVSFSRGRATLRALGGGWREKKLRDVYVFKSFFSFLFFALFSAACVMALAGMRWGDHLVEERRTGQDLVICLDVSNSMLAEEAGISRLQRSIDTIRGVVQELERVRICLVVFKGQALQLFPLTEDRYVLKTALRYVGPALMSDPGSGLEQGIVQALTSFPEATQSYRSILLFTDGEYHEGDPLAAAQQARALKTPLHVVAVGSSEGAVVRLAEGPPLLDEGGDPVISVPDLEGLERIAEISGGVLFRLVQPDGQLPERILEAMQAQREGNMVLGMRREKKDRFRFLIGLSLIFLILCLAVKAVRWKNVL